MKPSRLRYQLSAFLLQTLLVVKTDFVELCSSGIRANTLSVVLMLLCRDSTSVGGSAFSVTFAFAIGS